MERQGEHNDNINGDEKWTKSIIIIIIISLGLSSPAYNKLPASSAVSVSIKTRVLAIGVCA